MKTIFLTIVLSISIIAGDKVSVKMTTNKGDIVIELNKKKAPISVTNFLKYAEKGHYNNLIFHRVIDGFMIQGGGFDSKMNERPTMKPIKNEAKNGLQNNTGTIAMARTSVIDSATSQFFINVNDNTFLNHRGNDPRTYGYAVFGKVTKGMTVVNQIKKTPTATRSGHQNVPVEPIIIKSVTKI